MEQSSPPVSSSWLGWAHTWISKNAHWPASWIEHHHAACTLSIKNNSWKLWTCSVSFFWTRWNSSFMEHFLVAEQIHLSGWECIFHVRSVSETSSFLALVHFRVVFPRPTVYSSGTGTSRPSCLYDVPPFANNWALRTWYNSVCSMCTWLYPLDSLPGAVLTLAFVYLGACVRWERIITPGLKWKVLKRSPSSFLSRRKSESVPLFLNK